MWQFCVGPRDRLRIIRSGRLWWGRFDEYWSEGEVEIGLSVGVGGVEVGDGGVEEFG